MNTVVNFTNFTVINVNVYVLKKCAVQFLILQFKILKLYTPLYHTPLTSVEGSNEYSDFGIQIFCNDNQNNNEIIKLLQFLNSLMYDQGL